MGEKYHEIIKVKPGLTGYWQVNGRSNIEFEERLKMDVAYIQERSLWIDFKVLVKTLIKVWDRKGAI